MVFYFGFCFIYFLTRHNGFLLLFYNKRERLTTVDLTENTAKEGLVSEQKCGGGGKVAGGDHSGPALSVGVFVGRSLS